MDTLLEVAAASGLEAEIVPRLTAAILYYIHPMDAATPADLLAEGTILTALSGVDPMYTLAVSVCVLGAICKAGGRWVVLWWVAPGLCRRAMPALGNVGTSP